MKVGKFIYVTKRGRKNIEEGKETVRLFKERKV